MKNKIISRNKAVFLAGQIITSVAAFAITGAIYQTFLSMIGFSSKLLYVQTTVIQAVNIAVILIGSCVIPPSKSIRGYILATAVYAALFLFYLPLCRNDVISVVYLFAISVLQAVTTGIRTTIVYNLPYLLFPDKDYGVIMSAAGTVSSVLTLIMSKAINVMLASIPYITLIRYFFVIVSILCMVEATLYLLTKSIISVGETGSVPENRMKQGLLNVIKNPMFYKLAVPNLLRGFAYGVIDMMAIVALSLGYDENTTVRMVSVMSAANLVILGITFVLFKRQVQPRLLILGGSICFIILGGVFIHDGNVFLAVYALVYAGRTCIDYGVPVMMRNIVPLEIATSYNALRMILHTGGIMIAGVVASMISTKTLIIVTIVMSVVSGILYAGYSKKDKT